MQNCDNCIKKNKWRNTGRIDKFGAVIRQCTNCGHLQAEPSPQGMNYPKRILYYDIETSRISVDIFNTYVYSRHIHWTAIEKPSFLLCWSAAWVTEDTTPGNLRVMSDVVTPKEAKRRNDKRCLTRLWELMNQADYICGHNSKSFDTKKAHWYFLVNKMKSPDLTVKQIDTWSLARKYFRAESNALEYLRKRMGGGPKDDMRSEDWRKCELGDERALRKMVRYNKGDVREGVGLFLDLKHYIESGGGVLVR